MDVQDRNRGIRSLVWGVFLIVLGGAFLLDRFGTIDLPSMEHLWPAVFYVIGTIQFAEARFGSGLTSVLLGTWFFACNEGWWGFDYGNSWPLLLVAIGIGIVVKALTGESRHRWGRGGAS